MSYQKENSVKSVDQHPSIAHFDSFTTKFFHHSTVTPSQRSVHRSLYKVNGVVNGRDIVEAEKLYAVSITLELFCSI
jgi:hypothetical protein